MYVYVHINGAINKKLDYCFMAIIGINAKVLTQMVKWGLFPFVKILCEKKQMRLFFIFVTILKCYSLKNFFIAYKVKNKYILFPI